MYTCERDRTTFTPSQTQPRLTRGPTGPPQKVALAVHKIGLTSAEVHQCTLNALDAAFADEATREAVRAKLGSYVWPHEREARLTKTKRRAAVLGVVLVGVAALGLVLTRRRLASHRS